ncbi:VOC family protein [Variovorax sp. J22P271]|uniref:VOC family protein n=1 Tax=Variovorax davisae TaxID=3053515 RepID=UPI002576875F|nr:VOC family protein [Variovorax sp. J22P271]MDM0032466.1 VOC family protein [Variovorax sp. J22P271]
MRTTRSLPDATREAIRPAKLAHVVLRTSDLQRSRAWYLTVLQARPSFENESVCFLSYDEEHHRIGLIAQPALAVRGESQAGMDHMAFTYASLGELLATHRRLKAEGITPYWTINHGPTISLYYKDPDGNRLELQHDVFETADEVQAFFSGGAYRENFIGVKFDPEDLTARYEAGEAMERITSRPLLQPGTDPWEMVVF